MVKTGAIEDLETYWETLQGPLGDLLRRAGAIMAQQLVERGVGWSELSDTQVMDLFHAAFVEAVPAIFPQTPPADIEALLRMTFQDVAMQLAANASASDGVH